MFKSESDREVDVGHETLHGLELLGGALEDHEDVIYKSLPEGNCPDKGFPNGFYVTVHKGVGVWWGSLDFHGCANKLEKMPVHE